MKVTVEGSMDQIADVLNPRPPKPKRAPRGAGYIAEQNRIAAEQHAILRQAFELVRWKLEDKEIRHEILDAMVGHAERTKAVMDKARLIILERS